MSKELEIIKERLNAKHPYDNANTCIKIKHLYQAEVQTILNLAEALDRNNTEMTNAYIKLTTEHAALKNRMAEIESAIGESMKTISYLMVERDTLRNNGDSMCKAFTMAADISNKRIDELLNLIKKMLVSLALCDHLGDVGGDVYKVLKELDIKLPKDNDTWQENILVWAAENDITTLHGSKIER